MTADPLQPIRDVLAAARAWRDHDWVDQREALDAAIDALPDDTDALLDGPPEGRVLILATRDVLDTFGTRTMDGRLMTMDLGEPDEHGWYAPTFTAHDDGFPQAARDGLALAALREALPEHGYLTLRYGSGVGYRGDVPLWEARVALPGRYEDCDHDERHFIHGPNFTGADITPAAAADAAREALEGEGDD